MDELTMWQRLIAEDVTKQELEAFIRSKFKYIEDNISEHGLKDIAEKINAKDYPDKELHSLIKKYLKSRELLVNYINKKANEK
jgi:hydroxypyruvate isomerase